MRRDCSRKKERIQPSAISRQPSAISRQLSAVSLQSLVSGHKDFFLTRSANSDHGSRIITFAFLLFTFALSLSAAAQDGKGKEGQPSKTFERAQAVSTLAESKDAEALNRLKQALSDSDWYVRGEAARAYGRLGYRGAAADLLPLIEDSNWFVRGAALQSLITIGDASVAVKVQGLLESPDPYERARAATALGRFKYTPAADSLILKLSDNEDMVRRSAAAALGEMKASSAAEALIRLLKDGDPGVRVSAAVALGHIGEKPAAPMVASAMNAADGGDHSISSDSDHDLWQYAAALYRLGDRSHLDRITAALRSPYRDVRFGALQTLSEFADPRSLAPLLELAKTPARKKSLSNAPGANGSSSISEEESLGIRFLLARSLGRFEGDEAERALMSLLEDPAPQVRAAAVASLGKSNGKGSQAALGPLVGLLKTEKSPLVVSAVTEALASFDRERVADMLLDLRGTEGRLDSNAAAALASINVTAASLIERLKEGSEAERLRAIDRLDRLGDSSAVEPLMNVLASSKEIDVRTAAARALGSLKDRRAVESLSNAAGATEKEVRAAAVASLGLIGDPLATDALFRAAKDEDPDVRAAAVASLALLGIAVERLASDLSHSGWQVRAAAVSTLARLGDPRAVPAVVAALKDNDERVRAEAAGALGSLADASAINPLIAALKDPAAEVRIQATMSLGRFKAESTVGPLTALLNDRDPRVSLAAAESLARMQDARATRVLIEALSSQDYRVRARAAQVLAHVSSEGRLDAALPSLASAMRDKDPVVRYHAAEALIAAGARAVTPLLALLRSEREADRGRAARVLWRIGTPSVEPLLGLLQDKSARPETRAVVAATLGMIGERRAIGPLIELLKDERYYVRQQAARALGQMGEPAVEQVVGMARSSVPATREAAIEALGGINSGASIDRIVEALTDSNTNVRSAAVKALGETSSERAVPHLMAIMRDESSTMRSQAAASLARLGPLALPALVSALRDSHPSVRALAAESLGDIGASEAVAPLIDLVRRDTSGARSEAIQSLGKIGDPAAIDAILAAMQTGSVAVRKRAAAALARFRDDRAVDGLVSALSDRSEEIRQLAAEGLGEIGGSPVVPHLEKVVDSDSSADVRTRAIAVLIEKYFVKKTVVQSGYPLDMRYAGPREALLHALFRQNYGC
ncbi:MAG: HEAT repeat domain-containing protein, partial [Blastocatellia bacterium]|nr:HEAT repeat domain-containing protein [Blastocatellia bacterium]